MNADTVVPVPASPLDAAWRLAYRLAYRTLRVWWRLRRPRAEGAGVAVWREGRLLVVRTSYRGDLLDLPGGGLARGEAPRAAAARELREETGLEAPEAELVEAARLEFGQDGRRVRDTVFAWRPSGSVAVEPRADGREVVWVGWLAPEELQALPLTPGLAGYLTVAVGQGGAGDARLMASGDGRIATPGRATPRA